jgi:hypothetical protein
MKKSTAILLLIITALFLSMKKEDLSMKAPNEGAFLRAGYGKIV